MIKQDKGVVASWVLGTVAKTITSSVWGSLVKSSPSLLNHVHDETYRRWYGALAHLFFLNFFFFFLNGLFFFWIFAMHYFFVNSNPDIYHKGEKRKSYNMQFKEEIMCYADETSNRKVAKRFIVEPKRICEWKDQISKIDRSNAKQMQLEGAGIPLIHSSVKEVAWMYGWHSYASHVWKDEPCLVTKDKMTQQLGRPSLPSEDGFWSEMVYHSGKYNNVFLI